MALNFLTQYKENGNDLLEQIITIMKVGSFFMSQKEYQRVLFGKKEGEPRKFKNEQSVGLGRWC